MALGLLSLKLHFPACESLKEKRRRLRPLLNRLHKEFNVSVAEMEYQDIWQSAVIGCACLNSDLTTVRRQLDQLRDWIEKNWPDVEIEDTTQEIF